MTICRRRSSERPSLGFTLAEMLVTISLIVLIASIALPSVMGLFSAGADAQAYNILAAQLIAARALAITEGTYTGVHVQMADPTATRNPDENTCWIALTIYRDLSAGPPNPPDMKFVLAEGYSPRKVPGNIAFGQLNGSRIRTFVSGSQYVNLGNEIFVQDFCSFTVIFSPSGSVVTTVNGQSVQFDDSPQDGSIFRDGHDGQLWDFNVANAGMMGEWGATAVTMFNYIEFRGASDQAAYLSESGQFLPINVYTGQLLPRK